MKKQMYSTVKHAATLPCVRHNDDDDHRHHNHYHRHRF